MVSSFIPGRELVSIVSFFNKDFTGPLGRLDLSSKTNEMNGRSDAPGNSAYAPPEAWITWPWTNSASGLSKYSTREV